MQANLRVNWSNWLLFSFGTVGKVDNDSSGEACSHGLIGDELKLKRESKLSVELVIPSDKGLILPGRASLGRVERPLELHDSLDMKEGQKLRSWN